MELNTSDYDMFPSQESVTTPGPTDPSSWFQVMTEIFQAYINPIFSITGVVSNIMSVAVFTSNRAFDRSGTVQYLTFLAIFDIWNSFYFGIIHWLEHGLPIITSGKIMIDLPVSSTAACKILRFSAQVAMLMSGWILVLFSAERSIAVCFPLKLATLVTSRGRKIALSVLLVLVLGWQSKTIIFYDVYVARGIDQCFWVPSVSKLDKLAVTLANLALNLKLPCLLITGFNIIICVALVRHKSNRASLNPRSVSNAEVKCMVNLILVSVLYVVTTLPSAILWSYNNYVDLINTTSGGKTEVDFVSIFRWANLCDSLLVINYSLNFAIYSISLDFYSETLKRWGRGCYRSGEKTDRELSMSSLSKRTVETIS